MDAPINLHAQARRGGPTKKCNDCFVELPEEQFMKWFSPQRQRMRRSPYCSPCRLERHRRQRLLKEYGLSAEQYDELYESQGGQCAICKRKPEKIFIDHCHTEGHVRGLLCINCNSLLGQAKDNINILNAAIKYLQER